MMDAKEFRTELTKIMPGYRWTLHRRIMENYLAATGTISSGFNRLSTLEVVRRETNGIASYEVRSAGYGTRAPWLSTYADGTLARALRGLQEHYEAMAVKYGVHARALKDARMGAEQ